MGEVADHLRPKLNDGIGAAHALRAVGVLPQQRPGWRESMAGALIGLWSRGCRSVFMRRLRAKRREWLALPLSVRTRQLRDEIDLRKPFSSYERHRRAEAKVKPMTARQAAVQMSSRLLRKRHHHGQTRFPCPAQATPDPGPHDGSQHGGWLPKATALSMFSGSPGPGIEPF